VPEVPDGVSRPGGRGDTVARWLAAAVCLALAAAALGVSLAATRLPELAATWRPF
jgi:hypothetical protein